MAARAVERAHDRISWTPAARGPRRSAQRKPRRAARLKTRWAPQGGAPPPPGSSSEPTGPVRTRLFEQGTGRERFHREGEAPAEPVFAVWKWLGRSLALPK